MYLTFVDNKAKIVLCKFSNRTLFFVRQESEKRERDGCIGGKGNRIEGKMNNGTMRDGKRLFRVPRLLYITGSKISLCCAAVGLADAETDAEVPSLPGV